MWRLGKVFFAIITIQYYCKNILNLYINSQIIIMKTYTYQLLVVQDIVKKRTSLVHSAHMN